MSILHEPNEIETNLNIGQFVSDVINDPDETVEEPKIDTGTTVPEKFKGKSLEDVIESYTRLESEYGRMSQEIGNQRQLINEAIMSKRQNDLQGYDPASQEFDVDVQDLLDDPKKVFKEFWKTQSATIEQSYQDRINQLEAKLAANQFTSRHSDVNEIAQSRDWHSWLNESPLRLRAAEQARQGDYTVATELLDEYKASRSRAAATNSNEPQHDPLKAARDVGLEGGSANNNEGGQVQGKVISRQALQKLRMTDPDAYNDPAFQAKIVQAYQQGRVR